MIRKILVRLTFFSLFVFLPAHGESITFNVCDGASGFAAGTLITTAGVAITVFSGMVCHGQALEKDSSHFYKLAAIISYALGGAVTVSGLRLMYKSFKKMIGVDEGSCDKNFVRKVSARTMKILEEDFPGS